MCGVIIVVSQPSLGMGVTQIVLSQPRKWSWIELCVIELWCWEGAIVLVCLKSTQGKGLGMMEGYRRNETG